MYSSRGDGDHEEEEEENAADSNECDDAGLRLCHQFWEYDLDECHEGDGNRELRAASGERLSLDYSGPGWVYEAKTYPSSPVVPNLLQHS